MSFGGSLLRNFLESNPYVLLNNHENAIGGPYTRYDPSVPNKEDSKSCLDLVIVSAELSKYVKQVIIDKDLEMTTFIPLSRNRKIYSDHYAIMCVFDKLPLSSSNTQTCKTKKKISMWNLNKAGGWQK